MTWCARTGDREGTRLSNFVEDIFLYQTVHPSTLGNSILDLFLTTDKNLIYACEVGELFTNSDHNIIRSVLDVQGNSKEKFPFNTEL